MPTALRDALARALRDPSLTLAYWLPQFRSWADLEGRPVELPSNGSGRETTLIDRDGAHVAALSHDPALADERELLDAVTAAAGIAIENGRLHVELSARLEELKGSRARIVEAGQKERKRLERNLHDGAQQRLIALSLELSCSRGSWTAIRMRAAAGPARREIAASLEELREVARGLHPAVVSGHGLEVALEQLVARAPVPVQLTVELDRACRRRSRWRRTTSSRRASRTSASTLRRRPRPSRSRVERRAGRRGRRRRRRRRRHRAGLGPARTGRPGRGARGPAAGLEPRSAAERGCGRRSRAGSDRGGQRAAPRRTRAAPAATPDSRSSASAGPPRTCC